ncbi:hypothetical protein FRC06_007757, partial [Ceratobasidium sp. 370]
YAYADFALASVLFCVLSEGVTSCGVHYDIMCHYLKKLWNRWAILETPLSPLTPDSFILFIAAIPKFHLAGHTDGCRVRFSLNHLFGVGRLDAEGGELCWSNLNHAVGSTMEKGPGSCVDTLNHVMHQWNWSKTVDMASFLLRKWQEAKEMSKKQHDSWIEFSSSLDPTQTASWASMSTEPTYDTTSRQWTSVFSLPDPPGTTSKSFVSHFLTPEMSAMSLATKLKELSAQEQTNADAYSTSQPGPGVAAWVSTALETLASLYIFPHIRYTLI